MHVDGDDLEHIDKSVVVVGGFNEKTVEEAEALVQQMMVGIAGYKSVEMIDGESPLGLATFDSPIQAMKFIRSQKKWYDPHEQVVGFGKSITDRTCSMQDREQNQKIFD